MTPCCLSLLPALGQQILPARFRGIGNRALSPPPSLQPDLYHPRSPTESPASPHLCSLPPHHRQREPVSTPVSFCSALPTAPGALSPQRTARHLCSFGTRFRHTRRRAGVPGPHTSGSLDTRLGWKPGRRGPSPLLPLTREFGPPSPSRTFSLGEGGSR